MDPRWRGHSFLAQLAVAFPAQLAVVDEPAIQIAMAQSPDELVRRATADLQEVPVLSMLVVEDAKRDPIGQFLASPVTPINDVVRLQVAARRTSGSCAPPTVSVVLRILRSARHRSHIVPRRAALLEHRQQRHPARQVLSG